MVVCRTRKQAKSKAEYGRRHEFNLRIILLSVILAISSLGIS
ncbi:MAG: hypothetical protein WA667_19905 [Candidatus Nitrosopolaris sp.]